MEQRFRIGEIANTHGIRGEVKVYPTTDDVARFKKIKKNVSLKQSRGKCFSMWRAANSSSNLPF